MDTTFRRKKRSERNRPAATCFSMSWFVAATIRTSTRRTVSDPTGRTSPSCSTRSIFACRAAGMSPISSRNRVPPSASTKRPRLGAVAPENAPRVCPKSSLSSRLSGRAVQFTATNGGSRAPAVESARDELLSRAALPRDEDGRRRLSDLRHDVAQRGHGRARADEGARAVLLDRAAQDLVRVTNPGLRERALDEEEHLRELEGLRQVVEGAALDGVDGGVDGAEGGHHDDRRRSCDDRARISVTSSRTSSRFRSGDG